MKSCTEMNEWISLYIDNELGEKEHQEFEEHLATCESCRLDVEELKKLVAVCSDMEEAELPEGFREQLHTKLLEAGGYEAGSKMARIFNIGRFRLVTSVAAGLLVVAAAAFLMKSMLLTPSRSGSSPEVAMADDRAAKSMAGSYGDNRSNAPMETTAPDSATATTAEVQGSSDVKLMFSQAIPTDSNTSSQYSVDGTGKAKAEAKVGAIHENSGSAKGSTGSGGTGTGSNPGTQSPAAAMKLAQPEKQIATLTIAAADPTKVPDQLAKIFTDYSGEKVVQEQKSMGVTVTTGSDSGTIQLEFRIPSGSFDSLRGTLEATFGTADIILGNPTVEDTSTELASLNQRLGELDSRLGKYENKEITLTEDELRNIENEKQGVESRIQEINQERNYTYITVTVQKK